MTLPRVAIMQSARITASSTAGTLGRCRRRNRLTTGPKTKESNIARVIGISTSRAR